MNPKTLHIIAMVSVIALAIPAGLAAQNKHDHNKPYMHHHYAVIDMGTFGGPRSYVSGFIFMGPTQNLNNRGTLSGWSNTAAPDPYPDFCFNGDCYVSHAFRRQDGAITDLGVLPGGSSSATSWASANGLIVGASQNGETDPLLAGFPEDRAVLWQNGSIIDLGTLPEGGYESGAQAVNNRGQVVGWALDTVPDPYSMALWSTVYNYYTPVYPFQERAFLWQNGAMQDLGTLGTGTDAYATAVNERGQVIGISYTNSTPNQAITPCSFGSPIPTQDPFLWENGKMTDLGTLGGTCGSPGWINSRGRVVGFSDLAGDRVTHPFLWTKALGMQDLGTLGGSMGGATMINDSGVVVGGSTLVDGQSDAFLWDGTMHDLGALNGCAAALAINARGQVVGNFGGPNCAGGAFLWENENPMVDLNALVSSNSGFVVKLAININDRGEITGRGRASGCVDSDVCGHDYLLIPCDENHPNVEGCDYSLADASAAAQVPAPRYVPSGT
jgi:probable HAF family extracellular repeat protein